MKARTSGEPPCAPEPPNAPSRPAIPAPPSPLHAGTAEPARAGIAEPAHAGIAEPTRTAASQTPAAPATDAAVLGCPSLQPKATPEVDKSRARKKLLLSIIGRVIQRQSHATNPPKIAESERARNEKPRTTECAPPTTRIRTLTFD